MLARHARSVGIVFVAALVLSMVFYLQQAVDEPAATVQSPSPVLRAAPPAPAMPLPAWNETCEAWMYREARVVDGWGDGAWREWPLTSRAAARSLAEYAPGNWSQLDVASPPTLPGGHIRGAFVLLARKKNMGDLLLSLARLDRYYLSLHPTRVLLFHDDLGAAEWAALRAVLSPPAWEQLELHEVRFCVPSLLPSFPPRYVGDSPINYRHMMRFFARMLFSHPALARFSHYARLDTDSLLTAPVARSLFSELHDRGAWYGFTMLWRDDMRFLGGLKFEAERLLRKEPGQAPRGGQLWRSFVGVPGAGDEVTGQQFWNNFEVVNLALVDSAPYQRYIDRVDRAGLMYSVRLGDAPIRSVAVAALLRVAQIHAFRLPYQHQSQFRCPLDEVEGGSGVMLLNRFSPRSSGDLPPADPDATALPPPLTRSARTSACDVSDSLALIRDRCHSRRQGPGGDYCALNRRAPCVVVPDSPPGAPIAWLVTDGIDPALCDLFR
jgi:hypothetical protein